MMKYKNDKKNRHQILDLRDNKRFFKNCLRLVNINQL